MTILSTKNSDVYEQIGKMGIPLLEFTAFLENTSLFNKRNGHAFHWATLLYMGAFSDQPLNKLEQEFQKLDAWDPSGKEEGSFQKALNGGAFSAFDRRNDGDSVFSEIYKTLEGLRRFAEQ